MDRVAGGGILLAGVTIERARRTDKGWKKARCVQSFREVKTIRTNINNYLSDVIVCQGGTHVSIKLTEMKVRAPGARGFFCKGSEIHGMIDI